MTTKTVTSCSTNLEVRIRQGSMSLSVDSFQSIYNEYRKVFMNALEDDFNTSVKQASDDTDHLTMLADARIKTHELIDVLFFNKEQINQISATSAVSISRKLKSLPPRSEEVQGLAEEIIAESRKMHLEILDGAVEDAKKEFAGKNPFVSILEELLKYLKNTYNGITSRAVAQPAVKVS